MKDKIDDLIKILFDSNSPDYEKDEIIEYLGEFQAMINL